MHGKISDEMLDRLVDGELTPAERRGTLEQLEQIPGGWRRCALAFLEAQAWSRSLQDLTQPRQQKPLPVGQDTRGSVSWAGSRPRFWAAIAASLVAAFFLGRFGLSRPRESSPTPVSQRSMEVSRPAERVAVTPAENTLANRDASMSSQKLADTSPAELPEIWTRPMNVPQDVRHSLKTLGMEVRHQHGLASAENKAGQPVWVPYRDVTIVPVGDYQTY